MNKLSPQDQTRVVAALVEGNSLRAVTRMTGVHRTTIMKLLVDLGRVCSEYQDRAFRNLPCKRIQCDEIWSFVGCKQKNVRDDHAAKGRGDVWTWTAIDVARESIYTAPSAHKRLLKNLEAACEVIAMRWGSIDISAATDDTDTAEA